MTRKLISRVLRFAYPALIIGIAFISWSSAKLAEVAHFTVPPVGPVTTLSPAFYLDQNSK